MDSEGPNVGQSVRKPVSLNLLNQMEDRSQLNEGPHFGDKHRSCFAWHAIG
jgi:hypothetical protein